MHNFLPDFAIVTFSLLKHPVSTIDFQSYTAFVLTRFRLFDFEDQALTEIMHYCISVFLRAAELELSVTLKSTSCATFSFLL